MLILGLFLGLALFSKIQIILDFFVYFLLFNFKKQIKKKKIINYLNLNYFFKFYFSIIIFCLNKSVIDSFVYFLLFSFFNFYFYNY